MGLVQYPEFISGFNTSRSIAVDCQRLVNWYVELVTSRGGKVTKCLYPTPGYTAYSTLGSGLGPVKTQFSQNGRHFAVSDGILWEVASTGIEINRGVMGTDANEISISSSGIELLIISAGSGYAFNLGFNTLTLITDANFPANAIMGEYLLGRFVVIARNSRSFSNSALNDALTWSVNPNTKASADNILAIAANNNELWLIGEQSTQIWYLTGDATVVFAQRIGAEPLAGTNASFSVIKLDNGLFMMGSDENGFGVVLRTAGYGYAKVSSPELDTILQGYSGIDRTVSSSIQINGHMQLQLYFPIANATWRYDIASNQWYEAAYWNTTLGVYEAYMGRNHVVAFGKHIIGSRADNKLYQLSDSVYTEDGNLIRRLRRAPHLSNEEVEMTYNMFKLVLAAGLGLSTGQGSDPKVMLRYSWNAGSNWSDEIELDAGMIGDYECEAVVWTLGQAKDMVFEITVTDPIPWYILKAILDIFPGLP